MKMVLKDEGVILFFFFLPVAYPLLYSWIYNNEVVREVPVVVVDDSHSALSREFTRKFDASPDVSVAFRSKNMAEAQSIIGHGKAYGILYFPNDFEKKAGRHEQAHVGVYCDMSYMLTYKAIVQTATAVSGDMGKEIQTHLAGHFTSREEEIASKPLDFEDVPIFNTTGGYGNFILPAVLVLIIQQAMALGVGMISGTRREQRRAREKLKQRGEEAELSSMPSVPHHGTIATLLGQSLAYLLIFAVMLAWITLIVPKMFGFVSMVHGKDLLSFFTPYLLACVFLAISLSPLIRYRESVILVVVFTSVPLLFLAGVSWPQSAIPGVWQGVSWMFPSSFAVRGFIRMSSMGALLDDVRTEYIVLWIQTLVYFCTALLVTHIRVRKDNS